MGARLGARVGADTLIAVVARRAEPRRAEPRRTGGATRRKRLIRARTADVARRRTAPAPATAAAGGQNLSPVRLGHCRGKTGQGGVEVIASVQLRFQDVGRRNRCLEAVSPSRKG